MRRLSLGRALVALCLLSGARWTPAQGDLASPEVPIAIWASGRGSGLRSLEATQTLVQTVRSCGFNTLVAVVRSEGNAYYRSRLEPRGVNISTAFPDPLATVINECQTPPPGEPRLRVLAGVDVLLVHRGATLPARGHVALEHPEWLMQDRLGAATEAREDGVITQFLDPSLVEVREYTADVVREIVTEYEIDGLVLDNLRYPEDGAQWGYSALALERYHEAVGDVGIPAPDDPTWLQWRRDQVTELLRTLVQAVRAAKPDLPIYVGAETGGAFEGDFEATAAHREQLQSWPRWVQEELCDGLVVKLFRDGLSESGPAEFNSWLRFVRDIETPAPSILAVSGRLNYRNSLFQQMRLVLIGGSGNPLGLGLYDYDEPARDQTAHFYDDLRIAVFQSRRTDRTTATAEAASPVPPGARPSALLGEVSRPAVAPTPAPNASERASVEAHAAEASVEQRATGSEQVSPPPPASPLPAVGEEIDLGTLIPPPAELPPIAVDELVQPEPAEPATPSPAAPGVFENIPPAAIPRAGPLVAPQGTTGDTVVLEDGRRVTGQIVEEYEQMLTLRLDSGNVISIPRDRVQSIQHAGE